jgi:hypothetical protein
MDQRKTSLLPTLVLLLSLLFWSTQGAAVETQKAMLFSPAESQETLNQLRAAMKDQAPMFFSPKTHAWYACRLDKLPSAKDVIDRYPNPVGYGTGMDDCPLYEGALLAAIAELYDMTHAECLRNEAFEAYQGLKLCGAAHGIPGFVARGVCIEDGKSVYITTSRDQYTHYVDGLWRYYHSPLCDENSQREIRELLGALADTMKEQIVEQNDFGFLRGDGSKDPRGLHKMWHVYAHEAARLPMIYAAAWDVSGNREYFELYRKYLIPAVEQSIELKNKPKSEVNAWVPPYSCFQMECSLALLYRLEKDPKVKADILEAMNVAKRLASDKMAAAAKRGPRDLAEVLIAQLMIKEFRLADDQTHYLREALASKNLRRGGPPTTIHLLSLYCKACQAGILPIPKLVSLETWATSTHENKDQGERKPISLFPVAKKPVKSGRDENLVVFLSDPHVGAVGTNGEKAKNNLDQFKVFCDRIRAMKPRPAAVVIAGDLAFARGSKEDYELLKPILKKFDDAAISWKVCFGDADRREAFFEVFPQFKEKKPPAPGRLVEVLELPRADFILLDTLQEGKLDGAIDPAQREWLQKEVEKHQKSGKRFFVVSHHPANTLDIGSLLKQTPSCLGCISGHEHLWKRNAKSDPIGYSLQSTAYAPNNSTRCGFTYLKMDRWEFVFRPVSLNQDDLWERSSWVVTMERKTRNLLPK